MLTQVCPPRKMPRLQKFRLRFPHTNKQTRRGPGGETEASLNGASLREKEKKKKGRVQAVSELLQASLSHTVDLQAGSESSDQQGAALSLWSFLVLSVPHASFGVVVVKEVPQTESFHLQTILQHPGRREREKPPG